MEKNTRMGTNRTGVDMAPMLSKEMARGARELTPAQQADPTAYDSMVQEHVREAGPLGTVPVPGTVRGALKSLLDKATGHNPEVFINKLGERLAYERSGVRFYEAAIRKFEALRDTEAAGFPIDELRHIRNDEEAHFMMLKEVIAGMGADPTAQTPDADVAGVAGMGIGKVLHDPRTSMAQCLEMLLMLELADNDEWQMLITLAEDMGMDEVAARFGDALQEEEEHLATVRRLYKDSLISQASKDAVRH